MTYDMSHNQLASCEHVLRLHTHTHTLFRVVFVFLRGVGWNLNVPVFKGLYVNLFLNVL